MASLSTSFFIFFIFLSQIGNVLVSYPVSSQMPKTKIRGGKNFIYNLKKKLI